jgi:hypothetical protein
VGLVLQGLLDRKAQLGQQVQQEILFLTVLVTHKVLRVKTATFI